VLLHNGRADVDQPPEEALSQQNVERVFGVRSHQPTKFFPREFRL
jgi:ABC-type hemin transport system ATPase subunit